MPGINIIENSLSGCNRDARVPIKLFPLFVLTSIETINFQPIRCLYIRRGCNFGNKTTIDGIIIGTQFTDSIGILYPGDCLPDFSREIRYIARAPAWLLCESSPKVIWHRHFP